MGMLNGRVALVPDGGPVAETVSTFGPFCAKATSSRLASPWRMS